MFQQDLAVSAHISQGRGTVPEILAGNKKLAELCHAFLRYGGELRDGPKEARWGLARVLSKLENTVQPGADYAKSRLFVQSLSKSRR